MMTLLLVLGGCSIAAQTIFMGRVLRLRKQLWNCEIDEQISLLEDKLGKWNLALFMAAFAMTVILAIVFMCYNPLESLLQVAILVVCMLYLSWIQYKAME